MKVTLAPNVDGFFELATVVVLAALLTAKVRLLERCASAGAVCSDKAMRPCAQ